MGTLTDTPSIFVGTSRAFGTPFTLSAMTPALVVYTIELSVTAPLLSTQSVSVELKVDDQVTPTSVVDEAALNSAQLAGLGLISLQTVERQALISWVPAGNNILLTKTGAGSATLVNIYEVVF